MAEWFWLLLLLGGRVLGNLVLSIYYAKVNVPKRDQAGYLELSVGTLAANVIGYAPMNMLRDYLTSVLCGIIGLVVVEQGVPRDSLLF